MPKPSWNEMTVNEKLSELRDGLERLTALADENAARGNAEFSNINRRLSLIEETLKILGTTAADLLRKADPAP
ncbi:MAG TPA: hypothetical protein VGR45_00910 [Stellaceae bacterium]|nr:hypothetical protein [Stellaceae bacterium]